MIFAQQSSAYETTFESGVTGLVGVVSLMVIDNDGGVVTAASSAGIIETPAGSGIYAAERTAPATVGQYTVVWSIDGTFADGTVSIEDMLVSDATAEPLAPLPPVAGGGLQEGPCSAWTTDDDVLACCTAEVGSGDLENLDNAIEQASYILWRISGRRFSGSCQKTVRPCATLGCGFQVLSRGHIVWPAEGSWGWQGGGWAWPMFGGCGCQPLDRVVLDGYPVRAIVEVKIDGVSVPETDNWRLDRHRLLTRIADVDGNPQRWPGCQRLDLADTEVGTFSVTYTYGQDPPPDGQAAAAELACEIFKGCSGSECSLPARVIRETRQGVTIDFMAALGWLTPPDGTGLKTGLAMVDAFVNSVNPKGLKRRPMIITPGRREYPESVG